jgi:ubiquitin-like protein Pup
MVLAMAERTKKQRPSAPREEKSTDTEITAPQNAENTDRLKAELDDLLDDIDEVLETNAEDFVKSYVQKGGQ